MAIIEKLSMEDLENVTGGIIIKKECSNCTYYVLVNDKYGYYVDSCVDFEAAKYRANYNRLSTEVITPEEYEERYKQPFRW